MNLPRLLLGLVLAIALVLGAAAALPEAPGDAASPHPEHATLLVGGRPEPPAVVALGWAFGALQLGFFAGCFALGLRRREGLGPVARPLGVGLAVYLALWTALVLSYAGFARDPGAPLVGSFPAPTAWMLYALWPFPVWFAALYLLRFDDWVLSERDLARFRERLEELRAAADATGDPRGGAGGGR